MQFPLSIFDAAVSTDCVPIPAMYKTYEAGLAWSGVHFNDQCTITHSVLSEQHHSMDPALFADTSNSGSTCEYSV